MTSLCFNARYYRQFPPERYSGHALTTIEIDPGRSALLVVDVYGEGFTPADGEFRHHPSFAPEKEQAWSNASLNNIQPAIEAARQAGWPVIYVANSSPRIAFNRSSFGKTINRSLNIDIEELLSERQVDPLEYNQRDNNFIAYSKALAPQPTDYYVRKHFYSGFKDTRLDSLLRNLDIKTLFCVGYSGDICLFCTLIDAMELNYDVVLLRDCTMSLEIPEDEGNRVSYTERMIIWVETYAGVTITSRELVDALRGAGSLTPSATKG